jgi:hypothetical protein
MKVFTTRERIASVGERWRSTYPQSRFAIRTDDKADIYRRLQALDLATCSPQAVDEAIGNSSWTRINCDECKAQVDWVVQLGEEPDYESSTACICRSCLNKALLLSFP